MNCVSSARDESYLLVAALPGEVEQAGGEELILGAGTAVHGARLFQPEFCRRKWSTVVCVCVCVIFVLILRLSSIPRRVVLTGV